MCHCERSEAIPKSQRWRLLRRFTPRNDSHRKRSPRTPSQRLHDICIRWRCRSATPVVVAGLGKGQGLNARKVGRGDWRVALFFPFFLKGDTGGFVMDSRFHRNDAIGRTAVRPYTGADLMRAIRFVFLWEDTQVQS